MASNQDLIMAAWQGMVGIIAGILFVIAAFRYREKRSNLASTLAIALLFFAFAMAFQFIGELLSINSFPTGDPSWSSSNPAWFISWLLQLTSAFQFAYFFLILGLFMLHKFVLLMSASEKSHVWSDRAGLIGAIIIIAFGILRVQFPLVTSDDITDTLYQIDIWVIVFALFMVLPMISQAGRLLRRVEKKSLDHRHLIFMVLTGWILLGMILLFVLDTVFSLIGMSDASYYSRFAGFGCAMVGLIFAYLSFYSR
ncbi:MAG TPA: hypothetical protein VKM55_26595 [Candidatus Lokiarchaeia archaeon]|nr:hypothetical protein [Candidatus Lokiarchaeia archaeon]